ncbi:MAG: glycosyltransferase family 9 protein [Candidatus Puniceispirillaceae bacterium]
MTADSILVLKHGALGDVIQAMDAFAGLRQAYPKAEITLLTTAPFARLLSTSNWFDHIIVDPRLPGWRLDQALRLRSFFTQGWDMVIDLQCSARTKNYHKYFFAKHSGRWFGDAKGCSDPIPDFTNVNNRDRMVRTCLAAGAIETSASIDWLAHSSQRQPPSEQYCVLIPGCSAAKPSKRWPASHFIALGHLAMQAGITPLLVGTNIDAEAIGDVHQGLPEAVNLLAETSLADLAALAASSQFVVGNDTGPTFLAARSGQPTIMVMGKDTDPSMSAPLGAKAGYLRAEAISDITAQQIFDKALSMRT